MEIHNYCTIWNWKKMGMLVVQLCPTLWDPMVCSPPGSSVHEISQARMLGWVVIPFSRGSSLPRDWTHVSCVAGGCVTAEPPGKSLVPSPGIKPGPPEFGAWNINHWVTLEAPLHHGLKHKPAINPFDRNNFSKINTCLLKN